MSFPTFFYKIEIEGSIILKFIKINYEDNTTLKDKFYSYRFYNIKNIKEKFYEEENVDIVRLMFYIALVVDDELKKVNDKSKDFHDEVLEKLFLSYKDKFQS